MAVRFGEFRISSICFFPHVILCVSLCTKIIAINTKLIVSFLCKSAFSVPLKSQQGRESRRVRDQKACPPAFALFWSDPEFLFSETGTG